MHGVGDPPPEILCGPRTGREGYRERIPCLDIRPAQGRHRLKFRKDVRGIPTAPPPQVHVNLELKPLRQPAGVGGVLCRLLAELVIERNQLSKRDEKGGSSGGFLRENSGQDHPVRFRRILQVDSRRQVRPTSERVKKTCDGATSKVLPPHP